MRLSSNFTLKMKNYKVVLGLLVLGMPGIGFAQDVDQTELEKLDEVVITDSRFALKRENSGKTVIKISKEDIERNQGRSVAQLINAQSGIEINGSRSNAGQNLGVSVRGGRNRQVLVLIDGVQANDVSQLSGEYDFRLLNLNQIESIEIIKGAASTLYGSGAATAVINITTKKADNKSFQAVLTSVIGTNQSEDEQSYDIADFNNSVGLSGTLNKFTYRASFDQQFTDGLSAAIAENAGNDSFSKISADLNIGYKFSESFSLNIYGNVTDIESGFDGGAFFDADNFFNSKQSRVGLASKFKYTNGSINLNLAYSEFEREFISSFPSTPFSENKVIDLYNKYKFNTKFHTIIGINASENDAEFTEFETFTNVDPYANVVYVSDFGLNINAGGRLNNHSEYGTQFTYNLNPSYVLKQNDERYTKFFASYSTSFITPSLPQLFGFFGPNPDLDPEENLTIEGGVEFKLNSKYRISGLFFTRDEENTVQFVNGGYINAEEDLTVRGVEIELTANPIEKLQITANYAFTEFEDGVALRIPKHKANLNLGYDFSDKTFASLAYQFTYDRPVNDFSTFPATPAVLDSFSIFNLYASHTALENTVKFFAGVDNVLNEDFQDVLGFTSLGRNVRLGLQLTF